ncbi:MAG: hypothetical protein EBZ47_10470, partial [Chlamydiae bacterium]|nr:hypothetical protein [Chlamydiota bacterium]
NVANDFIIVTRNAKGDFNYEPHHAKSVYKSNPSLFQDHLLEIEKKFEEIEAHKDTPYNELVGIGVSNELQAVILGEKKLELAKRFLQVNEKVADAGYTDYQDGRTKKRVYVEEDGDNLVFRAIILTDAIKQGEKNLSSLRELQALDTKLRSEIEQKIQEAQVARLRGRDPDPLIELATAVFNANNDQRAGAVRAVEGRYDEIFGQIQDAQGRIERNQQEISQNSAQQRLIDAQIGKLEGEIERQQRQQRLQEERGGRSQYGRWGGGSLRSRGISFVGGSAERGRHLVVDEGESSADGAPDLELPLDPLLELRQQLARLQQELATLRQGKAELEGRKPAQKATLTQLQNSL